MPMDLSQSCQYFPIFKSIYQGTFNSATDLLTLQYPSTTIQSHTPAVIEVFQAFSTRDVSQIADPQTHATNIHHLPGKNNHFHYVMSKLIAKFF